MKSENHSNLRGHDADASPSIAMFSRPETSTLQLSIIIVSFNTCLITEKCLKSIRDHLEGAIDFEIIAVDNGSTDGSAEFLLSLAASDKRVKAILLDSNRGFGAANNAARSISRGKNVLFLNSDTEMIDSSLLIGLQYLSQHPRVGVLGGQLLNHDRSIGISYGYEPSFWVFFFEILIRKEGRLRAVVPQSKEVVHEIGFPCGAFFLARKEILDSVGWFDERYFMYYEEADLALRIKKDHWRIIYFPAIKVIHLGGASSSFKLNEKMVEWSFESLKKFYVKHYGILIWRILWLLLEFYYKGRLLGFKLMRGTEPETLSLLLKKLSHL